MHAASFAVLLVAAPGFLAGSQPEYQRIPIPVTPGYAGGVGAVNSHGQVLGTENMVTYYMGEPEWHVSVFLWTERNGRRTINTYLGAPDFTADKHFLNDQGHVAVARSWSSFPYQSSGTKVELWSESTGWQTVPGLTWASLFNNSDMIFGRTNTAQGLWIPGAGFYPLVNPAGGRTQVYDMNDDGVVVGAGEWNTCPQPCGSNTHPFIWTPATGLRYIDLPPGGHWVSGEALSVNRAGDVAGVLSDATSSEQHCFLWTPRGVTEDLGPCANGRFPVILNNKRELAAWKTSAGPILYNQGFFWSKSGGTRDIGSLGGGFAHIAAMNDRGEIVGESNTAAGGAFHAFVWSLDDGMTDLTPQDSGHAGAINKDGLIVGWSQATGPCVWTRVSHGR